jgi:Ca2+/Na+ antiporter
MGIFRMVVIGFVVLTIFYVLLSLYSRSVRREKLEKEWDEEVKTGDRDAYIDKGMAEYEGSLRRKLIVLVYVIPVLLVIGMLYVINFM